MPVLFFRRWRNHHRQSVARRRHTRGLRRRCLCLYRRLEPHAGPNGDTSGFGNTFDSYGSGTWTLLDKLDMGAGFSNAGALQFAFAMAGGTGGTWSVHNTGAVSMASMRDRH